MTGTRPPNRGWRIRVGVVLGAGLLCLAGLLPARAEELPAPVASVDHAGGRGPTLSVGTVEGTWEPAWRGGLLTAADARRFPLAPGYEAGQAIPRVTLVGMRVAFRPLPNLTVGLSHSAQQRGRGDPGTFPGLARMLLGRSAINGARGDPFGALAGADARLSFHLGGRSMSAYTEILGENRAAHSPGRDMAQVGWSTWGDLGGDGARYGLFAEYADTTVRSRPSAPIYPLAYDGSVYRNGFGYYGVPVGYLTDNGSRIGTAGWLTMLPGIGALSLLARYGQIDLGADGRNSVSPVSARYDEIRLGWRTPKGHWGRLDLGVGASRQTPANARTQSDVLGWIQWRNRF